MTLIENTGNNGNTDTKAVPEAEYQVAAVCITCPWSDCRAVFSGPNGTTLIVRQDSFRAGQTAACETCARPFKMPRIIDTLMP